MKKCAPIYFILLLLSLNLACKDQNENQREQAPNSELPGFRSKNKKGQNNSGAKPEATPLQKQQTPEKQKKTNRAMDTLLPRSA